jgi:PAS domain S-box-containing protein
MRRFFVFESLSWRLILAVSVVVVAGLGLGFHLTYLVFREEMLAEARSHAEREAQLVRLALTHQMLESKDRSLISGMVQSFAADKNAERILVLDRLGKVSFSSDPAFRKRQFKVTEPACQVCHARPAVDRERSALLELDGGMVLRSVQPIANRAACHECHDSKQRINGILIVDVPVGRTVAHIEKSVSHLALGTAAFGFVLIGGISLAFRRFLLRRLYRFERVANAIAAGDLEQRVPVEGNDAVSRLQLAFNAMVDSVRALLDRVEAQGKQLERTMNAVDDGMVVMDRKFQVVAANDAFKRRFGTQAPELMGCDCSDAAGKAGIGCDVADCPGEACLRSGKTVTAVRTRIDEVGQTHHEELRASPVYAPDGALDGVVEVWRDITDRRSAEARLAEYQRLASVGMLASGISHELNTPLGSIGTCLDAIERHASVPHESLNPARIQHYAQVASSEVRRCGTITRQFMNLARGQTPEREIIDLRATAELVAKLARSTAQIRGVVIHIDKHGETPPVLANGSAVQQVLLNLLINAVEASQSGSQVHVHFHTIAAADGQPGRLEIHVEDRGSGIEPQDALRVFEPFFSRRQRGSGLGLFVSLNLARGWGGDLRIVRTRVGEGTVFGVCFPLRTVSVNTGKIA